MSNTKLTSQEQTLGSHILGTRLGASIAVCICILLFPRWAQSDVDASIDNGLLGTSFEDLASYQVFAPTKSLTELAKSPGTVTLITYDDIQASSASSIPELLRMVPGLNIRWNPMVQAVDARSFGSNPFATRVLFLIDGVPFNSWNKGGFPQHPGFDFFNSDNVKHIEVIRGPGAALFGENAFSAVVNIVTLSGNEFDQTTVKALIGERHTRKIGVTSGHELGDDASLFVSARAEQGQLPTDLWIKNDSRAAGVDGFAKLRVGGFTASYYVRDDAFDGFEVPLSNPKWPTGSRFVSAKEIKQRVQIASLDYAKDEVLDELSVLFNASHSQRNGSHCGACHSPHGTTDEPYDYAREVDHGSQLNISAQLLQRYGDKNDFIFGVEHRKIASGDGRRDLSYSSDSILDISRTAYYLQNQSQFFDGAVRFIVGIRGDANSNQPNYEDDIYPRIAMVARLSEAVTFRANWSEAARFPTVNELYLGTPFLVVDAPAIRFPLLSFTPNPDLTPERIKSLELSATFQPSNALFARLAIFNNEIRNAIDLAYPDMQFRNSNAAALVSGFEVEARYSPNNSLNISGSWSHQSVDTGDVSNEIHPEPYLVRYGQRNRLTFSTHYKWNRSWSSLLEAEWRGEYFGPAYRYQFVFGRDSDPKPLPPFALVNFQSTYRLPYVSSNSRRPLSLRLIIKNALDKEPYETLSGIGGHRVGREVFLSIEYDWTR